MLIIKAEKTHIDDMAELANALWGENPQILINEFVKNISKDDIAYFIKVVEDRPVAFAHCQLRYDYVEGTNSSPVGYLEGIFVKEDFRLRHIASELIEICEKWSKGHGCTEFASDCELDNRGSMEFHLKNGFEEMNRVICFRKSL